MDNSEFSPANLFEEENFTKEKALSTGLISRSKMSLTVPQGWTARAEAYYPSEEAQQVYLKARTEEKGIHLPDYNLPKSNRPLVVIAFEKEVSLLNEVLGANRLLALDLEWEQAMQPVKQRWYSDAGSQPLSGSGLCAYLSGREHQFLENHGFKK